MTKRKTKGAWRQQPDGDWERTDGAATTQVNEDGAWVWRAYVPTHAETDAGYTLFTAALQTFKTPDAAMRAVDWWFPLDA